jgi:hypothetical protein
MITNRRTVRVKQGRMDEYAAMVLVEAQQASLPHGYRLHTSDIGTSNILALEMDFDCWLSTISRMRSGKGSHRQSNFSPSLNRKDTLNKRLCVSVARHPPAVQTEVHPCQGHMTFRS